MIVIFTLQQEEILWMVVNSRSGRGKQVPHFELG